MTGHVEARNNKDIPLSYSLKPLDESMVNNLIMLNQKHSCMERSYEESKTNTVIGVI